MLAAARLAAEADGHGGTRLAVLRSEPPLVLRPTGPAEVHLVGGAAGPLGGDRLRIGLDVGPGASLTVRTVAASLALPGREGAESRLEVRATVATGGRLVWLPEPLIAAHRCRHITDVDVELAAGANLLWRDELVCGRHGEQPGDVKLATVLRLDGRELFRHELAVGPNAPGWSGPAVLGDARAVGSRLMVEAAWSQDGPPPAQSLGPTAAVMPLPGPALYATALASDAQEVRRDLDHWAGTLLG